MSLFRNMNTTAGVVVNESRYGHDTGMVLIAMESAQELYDIFCESTLAAEEAELDAVSEGVVLEGSQFEVVVENAVKSAYGKVKAFLEKLLAKVKAFMKQVRLHLDKIFMSGKDFVKKYKVEIEKAAAKAKDFEFKMYKYNNDEIDKTVEAADIAEKVLTDSTKIADKYVKQILGDDVDLDEGTGAIAATADMEAEVKAAKKSLEDDVKAARKKMCNGAQEDEDIAESLFKLFRNGATDQSDKEDLKWSSEFVNALEKGNTVSKLDTMAGKIDGGYKKAIKYVGDLERKADKLTGDALKSGQHMAEVLRELSSTISKTQTMYNQYVGAWKSAVTEREAAYKNCCMAVLRHKNK